jgi:hypothetical protein
MLGDQHPGMCGKEEAYPFDKQQVDIPVFIGFRGTIPNLKVLYPTFELDWVGI